MTPWGYALERLWEQSGMPKGEINRKGLTVKEAFTKWKVSKRGPTVAVLDRLIVGMGLTWNDWAKAFEAAKKTAENFDSSTKMPKNGLLAAEPKPTYKRTHRPKVRASPRLTKLKGRVGRH